MRTLISWAGTGLLVVCAATVMAQCVGLAALSARGMLTREKLVRYTGVLYGLDPLDLSPNQDPTSDKKRGNQSPEETLANRVQKTPGIAERQAAIRKGTDDIRGVVLGLKIKRRRHEQARKDFDAYLQQLATESTANARREIQITLEALPAKQAKDIIFSMLTESSRDPSDDVMTDLVTVIKAMQADKLRKIFEEFKSTGEREMLHRILVEIGDLDNQDTQLTGTQP